MKTWEEQAAEVLTVAPYHENMWTWWEGYKQTGQAKENFREGLKGTGLDPNQITQEQVDDLISEFMCSAYGYMSYAHFGFNTFNLTHGLTAMLLLTDPDRDFEHMPFDAFRVTLPQRSFCIEGGQYVKSIRLFRTKSPGEKDIVHLLSITEDNRTLGFRCLWPPNAKGVINSNGEGVTRLLVNLCAYLATKVEPLVMGNAKTVERASKKGKAHSRIYTLGRAVKISPELRAIATSGNSGPLWKLKHRHIVRGHWRNQAHGPGRTERTKKWIEPHWRGPTGAEAIKHIYELNAEKETA